MLEPVHILITGASSGLGEALALLYAKPGIVLSLCGRDEARLRDVAERAEQSGARVFTSLLDVRDASALKAWIADCHAFLPIDLAIANAGVSAGTSSGLESSEQINAVFGTNLDGVLNTVEPLLELMSERGRGQIALMSSMAGFRGLPGAPAYAASKAAVRVYGEALRGEMAPLGIEINVVCPGFVKTPMTEVNAFPMPFLMQANKAAGVIRKGLARNKARIAFPWRLLWLLRLVSIFPQDTLSAFLRRFPKKKAL